MPPVGYHRRTREVCDKYDVLYISDEVVTGFGRLGHFFASEAVFDFVPDIITSAKGISSGYLPLSATILSEKIYDVILLRPILDSILRPTRRWFASSRCYWRMPMIHRRSVSGRKLVYLETRSRFLAWCVVREVFCRHTGRMIRRHDDWRSVV